MSLRWSAALVIGVCLVGCGDDDGSDGSGGAGGTSTGGDGGAGGQVVSACPSTGMLDAAGACIAIAADRCPAGQRPQLGSEACVPVGFVDCPDIFELNASGSACVDALPAGCGPFERLDVVTGGCVALGDCNAAFPPAEATLFVDDSYGAGELDATHFSTIGEALSAAGAGDTIAVEAGTYVEALSPSGTVRVVGRCAEQVTVESTGGTAAGVTIQSGNVEVHDLTLTGHRGGVVSLGGMLRLERVRISANRDIGIGVFGGAVTLVESVVRDTLAMANGQLGRGINAEAGVTSVERSDIVGNREVGIFAQGTTLDVIESVVRDTQLDGAGINGRGVVYRANATGAITRSVVANNHDVGIGSITSTVSIQDTVVRGTLSLANGSFGRGVIAFMSGQVDLDRVSIVGNRDTGLSVETQGSAAASSSSIVETQPDGNGVFGFGVAVEDGSLELDDVLIADNRDFSVVVQSGALSMTTSLAADTQPSMDGRFGYGAVLFNSDVTVDRSALIGHRGAALFASDANVLVTSSIFSGTQPDPQYGFGHGVVASGASLQLLDVLLRGHADVGALFDNGTGLLQFTFVEQNKIGIAAQNGSELIEAADSGAMPQLREVIVAASHFTGNEQRIGGDVIPLPSLDLLTDP